MGRGKRSAAEAADTTAAGAIEGAGAVEQAGGTPDEVVAGAIGGAAAGTAEATGANDSDGGEDHITAFDRQMERLVGIAENAEFESGTLVGDIRDSLLDLFRTRPKVWSAMSEAEQRDVAKALENAAKLFVRKVVRVVAEEDLVSVSATLKGYSAKGDVFKLNAEARGDEDTALDLFRMDGHDVVIMSADAQRFVGQRKDAEVQPDQPALTLEPPQAGAEHPEDNSDLADAGEQAPSEDDSARSGVEGELDEEDEAEEIAAGESEREAAESE
jgi:hypothetical protein